MHKDIIVTSKWLWTSCIGLLGTLGAGLVPAQTVVEYTSLGSWGAAVSDLSDYVINGGVPPGGNFELGNSGVTFGPGTFAAAGNDAGFLFNDNVYGNGVQYFSDSTGAGGAGGTDASLMATFNASADVTAVAFTIGTYYAGNYVDIAVNGVSIAPITPSAGAPASAFLGITDTSGPITDITLTVPAYEYAENFANAGEVDVIGSYLTASALATAPEMDTASATGAITLLVGGLAVLASRKRA